MKLYSVWLIVLTMLMGSASAANVNFNGAAVSNCTLSGSTYNCSNSFAMGATDVVVIAGGYTVVMTSFSPSYNQGLTIAGSGALQTSGNLDLSNINPASVSTGGSTLTAGGSFKLGSSTTINGSVVAASIDTNSGNTITGSVSVSGLADLGSAIKINGNVSAGSFKTNSPGTIGGSITSAGTVFVGSGVTVGGSISGTTITTNSPVTLNGSVTASVAFTLASGSKVVGDIVAPTVTLNASSSTVTGNITTTGALDIGSGNTVNGTVKGGSLTLRASGATINGATTISGDVTMGSGTVINGDLSARNVTTNSSNAVINGNAAVNAIYIDWGNSVTKTITCTGAGASGCSCVTKADPNYQPTCGAAPSGVPHHFQISHTGSALTCQPQTVSVTACANAACTAPHFTSNVNVTLQPGGQTFTISGGINSAATVESKTAGTYTLSASATGVTAAPICVNTASGASGVASASNKPCDMEFKTTGLKITAPHHVSMTPNTQLMVEALTAAAPNQSCVPLVTGQTVNVDMACSFSNPVNAANVPVKLGTLNASCGAGTAGATVSVPLAFNSNGVATTALEYAEVGQVGLSASYTTSKYTADGSTSFIAAPARFDITATKDTVTLPLIIGPAALATAPTTVFAKAGEAFKLTVTAVNYKGTATSNFGKESTPSEIQLVQSINNPAEVPVPSGTGTNGALLYTFPVAFSGGSKTATDARFTDVGYLKLTAALKNNGYYLGQPIAIFQTTGLQYISRFVPDHFDVALIANGATAATTDTMDCSTLPVGINPCAAGTQFTHAGQLPYGSEAGYTGQPFLVKVSAYNGATPAALTANYTGALAKVVTLMPMKSSNNALADDNGAIVWSAEGPPVPTPAPTRFTFSATAPAVAGVGLLNTGGPGAPNLPTFKFNNSATGPILGPTTFYLRAIDTDGVSSLRVLPNITVEPLLTAVTGRLLVSNGYGSPTSPLPVQVRAQYYMPGGYVFNSLLKLTVNSPVAGVIKFSNCQGGLDIGSNTCPGSPNELRLVSATAGLTLDNGKASFLMAAPTPTLTKIGSADVQLKHPTTGRYLIPFLPSTTGRQTFGVYRSGPVIYTREVYN